MVVGARQSFRFFRHLTWFLGNNSFVQIQESDFELLNQHYQIIKKSVHKKQFNTNHASHLNKRGYCKNGGLTKLKINW